MTGNMRARQWMIAARFHDPSDYGVPEALAFHASRCGDGSVVLYSDDGTEVMRAGTLMKNRR